MTAGQISEQSGIDLWFTTQLEQIFEIERELKSTSLHEVGVELFRKRPKRLVSRTVSSRISGVANLHKFAPRGVGRHIHHIQGWSIPVLRNSRPTRLITIPPTVMKMSSKSSEAKKIMILGGGPNRIGQGIEFDYCCVHASRSKGFRV